MRCYGKELILDLHDCDPRTFTRKSIAEYFGQLCRLIDMEPCKLVWWDDLRTPKNEQETEPHLKGTSAIQFIKTSNITIHTLDILQKVFLNIFSCKSFNARKASAFSARWFMGKIQNKQIIERM